MVDHSGHVLQPDEFIKSYKRHPFSRSKLWKHFGFLADDSGQLKYSSNEAISELSNKCVKCLNNNTKLLTHLKSHHFIQHKEITSEIRYEESYSSESVGNSSSTMTGKQQSLMEMISRKEEGQCKVCGVSEHTSLLYL